MHTPRTRSAANFLAGCALALICGAFVCCALAHHDHDAAAGQTAPICAMAAAAFLRKDASLTVTKALPNGAASIYTDGIDLEQTDRASLVAGCELLISGPALSTAQLPDTKTITYDVQHDDDAAFGTAVTIAQAVLVQTGAGGAGAAAAEARFRLPSDVKTYVRVKATNSGTGNASAVSVEVALVS